MNLKVKKSKTNEWGFVESYRVYEPVGRGYIEAIVGITADGKFTKPYIYRGEEFIPLEEVDKEVSVSKYIKAKKPFYSKLADCFVVKMRASVYIYDKKYYKDSSSFEVYTFNELSSLGDTVSFKKVLNVPEAINVIMEGLLRELGESFGDREKFLRGRF